MTPEERLIRFNVGIELIESVILDFLRENQDQSFSSLDVCAELGVDEFYTPNEVLHGLLEKGLIVDSSGPKRDGRRWQIAETPPRL